MRLFLTVFVLVLFSTANGQSRKRASELGIRIGVMQPGKLNSITDVKGVLVGHTTLIKADSIRTGVTAILPHEGNLFQQKVPAAIYVGNGFGKLAGITQVKELGNIESPVILTNTLGVATAINAVITYTIAQKGNENVQSVNVIVGETNDGYLNDIRGRHVKEEDVLQAIRNASGNSVAEGNVGAGTGTICFDFKGGIGTASRVLPEKLGGYTVGVLVQTNFGGVLSIDGIPVDKEWKRYPYYEMLKDKADGSCMIVVATDAPLDARNLERLAKRAFMGLARTGGIASNGSGDYVIAFSTNTGLRIAHNASTTNMQNVLSNDAVTPLFMATIEASEEAIINSMLKAETMKGKNGRVIEALPLEELRKVFLKYNRILKL
jgi:D-aminopeptidase